VTDGGKAEVREKPELAEVGLAEAGFSESAFRLTYNHSLSTSMDGTVGSILADCWIY